jgi:hypothetical protein
MELKKAAAELAELEREIFALIDAHALSTNTDELAMLCRRLARMNERRKIVISEVLK